MDPVNMKIFGSWCQFDVPETLQFVQTLMLSFCKVVMSTTKIMYFTSQDKLVK